MELLHKLTRFYKEEAQGIPHDEVFLFDLAYDLAELLEREGVGSNITKYDDEDDFNAFVEQLRREHNSVVIDTAVNHMHQGLLDAVDWSGEESMAMMNDENIAGDIREYLLNRDRILAEYGWA